MFIKLVIVIIVNKIFIKLYLLFIFFIIWKNIILYSLFLNLIFLYIKCFFLFLICFFLFCEFFVFNWNFLILYGNFFVEFNMLLFCWIIFIDIFFLKGIFENNLLLDKFIFLFCKVILFNIIVCIFFIFLFVCLYRWYFILYKIEVFSNSNII